MQNNTVKNKEVKVDLIQVLVDVRNGFLRKLWLYLALSACAGILAFAVAKLQYTPTYVASSTFAVSKHVTVNYHTSIEKSTISNWMGLAAPGILSSATIKNLVKDDLGYTEDQNLPAQISGSSVKDTNLVSLSVSAADPQTAYDVLQSALRCYSTLVADTSGGLVLDIVSESGIPTAPSGGAGGKKSAVSAFLTMLFACLVWLTVKAIMKKTVRNGEDLSELLGAEYLGTIPYGAKKSFLGIGSGAGGDRTAAAPAGKRTASEGKTDAASADGNRTSSAPAAKEAMSPVFMDAIRKIRHRIENEADRSGIKTILVTSAIRSEGKTTAAVYLAKALAKRDYNVLLIDGDLRNPSVLHALGMEPVELGIADMIAGKCNLDHILIPYKGMENLIILPGGKPVENPASLWGSNRAKELLRMCRRQCDYVIIDAPACSVVSDPALIAGLSDGCLFVTREDFAKTETIQEGRETLEGTGCGMLGCVLNEAAC